MPKKIIGTGNDEYVGGAEDDPICGADGNDVLLGGGGNDWLYGENGDDVISGGDDNDLLVGGNLIYLRLRAPVSRRSNSAVSHTCNFACAYKPGARQDKLFVSFGSLKIQMCLQRYSISSPEDLDFRHRNLGIRS